MSAPVVLRGTSAISTYVVVRLPHGDGMARKPPALARLLSRSGGKVTVSLRRGHRAWAGPRELDASAVIREATPREVTLGFPV